MPRGDKSAYTSKQKRQAEHIEQGYEAHGASKDQAQRRAWATVNKESGGGKQSGSGRRHQAPAKIPAKKSVVNSAKKTPGRRAAKTTRSV